MKIQRKEITMDNNIQTFYNNEFGELEVIQSDDKFWFPATKCAKILGYKNPQKAIRDHCKGVAEMFIPSSGGIQKTNIICEGDLYRLIIRSKMESARKFESWVFDEVILSIRKHGAYIMPELLEELQKNTEKNAQLLKTLAMEQRERILLEERNRALKTKAEQLQMENTKLESKAKRLSDKLEVATPKLSYYDKILDNPEAVAVTLIAKDYGMTAMAFNAMLHDFGIQYRVSGTWELYQTYADNGYTHGNVHFTRTGRTKMHTCWTQKGRLFLYEFLKGYGILPKIEVVS